MIDDAQTPTARPDVEFHDLADGGVLSDPASDRIHTLNVTAAYVWSCLDGQQSVRQIALDLHEAANIGLEAALADVRQMVACFQHEGLLCP